MFYIFQKYNVSKIKRNLAPNEPTEQPCSMYTLNTHSRIAELALIMHVKLRARERERIFHLMKWCFVLFVAHLDVLMTELQGSHLKTSHFHSHDDSILSRDKLFLVLFLFKPTMENFSLLTLWCPE